MSEYIFENVYMTFQHDEVAFNVYDEMNHHRLCWASPWSTGVRSGVSQSMPSPSQHTKTAVFVIRTATSSFS